MGMQHRLRSGFLSLLVVPLAGCHLLVEALMRKDDTGSVYYESCYDCEGWDTGSRTPRDPSMPSWLYDCGEETSCTFTAEIEGNIERLVVEVLHTGDPAFSCGPGRELVCGVWQEQYEVPGPPYTLTLEVVDQPDDQINGETTLFGVEVIQEITLYMQLFHVDGTPGVCVVGGHLPSYYDDYGCLEY